LVVYLVLESHCLLSVLTMTVPMPGIRGVIARPPGCRSRSHGMRQLGIGTTTSTLVSHSTTRIQMYWYVQMVCMRYVSDVRLECFSCGVWCIGYGYITHFLTFSSSRLAVSSWARRYLFADSIDWIWATAGHQYISYHHQGARTPTSIQETGL
jgi:hypothetical protein